MTHLRSSAQGENLVRNVLACEKLDINMQDNTGCTALSLAIEHKDLVVANFLASREDTDAMLQDSEGMSPWLWSIHCGLHSVTLILLNNSPVHSKDIRRGKPSVYPSRELSSLSVNC
jgi:ankyrin repeat protein